MDTLTNQFLCTAVEFSRMSTFSFRKNVNVSADWLVDPVTSVLQRWELVNVAGTVALTDT